MSPHPEADPLTPEPSLSVENLSLTLGGRQLVRSLTFSIEPGERVALLGASGSGKSLTAAALAGVVPDGIAMSGDISYGNAPGGAVRPGTAAGRTLAGRTRAGTANAAALVSQDPQASLNPLVPVGRQLLIPLRRTGLPRAEAQHEALGLLARTGLEDPAEIMARYTGELSGGQLQRVCIALALACRSSILVADEPTTALDPVARHTVLAALRGAEGRSLLFITHDLAAAAALCTRALVMEEGRMVEESPISELLQNPRHPYTQRLVAAAGGELPETAAAA
jgi:peptide/nickel transport system ATP-binding protein